MNFRTLVTKEEALSVRDEFANLFKNIFHRDIVLKAWEMHYSLNPYGDPIIGLGYVDDALAAYHALIPQRLIYSAGDIDTYYLSISLMIHEDHRGLDHFCSLVKATTSLAKERNAAFILGYPNRNSFLPLKRMFGWNIITETELYDWTPPDTPISPIHATPLSEFRATSGNTHPWDDSYRRWRSHAEDYQAERVNENLSIIYKLAGDTLTLLEIEVKDQERSALDLGSFVKHRGASKVRMTGVHARAIPIDESSLVRHTNYILRMCEMPIARSAPEMDFSLLLTDVF